MAFIAGNRLKIGDGFREPGEPVPEANDWKNLNVWLQSGDLIYVGDADQFAPDGSAIPRKDTHIGVPQPDSPVRAFHQEVSPMEQDTAGAAESDDGDGTEDAEVVDDGETGETESGETENEEVGALPDYMDDPGAHTVAEVLAYAQEHPEHAEMLFDMESEGKARTTLLDGLNAVMSSDE